MKKYLCKLAFISLLIVLLLIILAGIRRTIITNHSWRLPEKVHILFLGASHINHAVDDSMMESAINWTRGSERYMYTYIKLKHLLQENPQIDTVFLELAPTDLWEDTDSKYHDLNEQSGYVRLYWPFYEKEQWEVVLEEPIQVAGLILGSLMEVGSLRQTSWWNQMGGYFNTSAVMSVENVKPELAVSTGSGYAVNYHYLREIIEICKNNCVKLIFLETPTFHPEYYYNQDYFYKAYQDNFSDVEFVDYSKYPMLNDEYYDAHHLNHKGAVKFTKELINRFHIK